MYNDNVLLKIYRTYSKEESFRFLFDCLRATRFKNGELLSRISELEHENKNLRKLLNNNISS